jgi:nucleoside-diphosphate-sugar epimerase
LAQRILITGAGGFLAANLAHALVTAGAEVHALVRPTTRLWRLSGALSHLYLHRLSLTHPTRLAETIRQVQPQIIFHLAASGVHHRTATERSILLSNVFGAFNLLQALEPTAWEKLVITGGSSEYGQKPALLQESDVLQPVTFYGATKAAATLLFQQYARSRSRPVVILRPFSIYGPWEAPTRLVPRAILAALLGLELPLTAPGYRRDYVYVEDVVQACLLAAQKDLPPGEILNIGTGAQTSNEALVELVEQLSGRPIRILPGAFPARSSDTDFWAADIAKARRILGWTAAHSLPQGLQRTIEWFRSHLDFYA